MLFWTDPDAELASGEPFEEDSAWRNCETDFRTGLMGGPPSRLLGPETSGDSLAFSEIRDVCEILGKTARFDGKIDPFQPCCRGCVGRCCKS